MEYDDKTYSVLIAIKDNQLYAIYNSSYDKFRKEKIVSNNGNAFANQAIKDSLLAFGACPTNAYYDTHFRNEVCFDNNDGWCGNLKNEFNKTKTSTIQYDIADGTHNEDYNKLALNSNKEWEAECYYTINGSNDKDLTIYFDFTTKTFNLYEKDNGLVKSIKDNNPNLINPNADGQKIWANSDILDYAVLTSTCPVEIYRKECNNGMILNTQFTINSEESFMCAITPYVKVDEKVKENITPIDPIESPKDECELFGDEIIDIINSFLKYIRIIVPILVIGFGIVDFGSAVLASDDDKMKKAQKRFIVRLIVGVAIFFVPTLVNLLLNLANMVWSSIGPNSCNIG